MRKRIERDDADILAWRGYHEFTGAAHFERVTQDRRVYYRLVSDDDHSPSVLTDAEHARDIMVFWAAKGRVKS